MIKSVAVYLGSSGAKPKYMKLAYDFGRMMADNRIKVVYGGASVGTMGALADGVLSGGGEIVGVFPVGFGGKREVAASKREILRKDVTEIIEVRDFAQRKEVMRRLSDCSISLPGGYGTMDELFCYAVENEIGLHDKTAYVLNIDGYYDGLEKQAETMEKENFISGQPRMIVFLHSIDEFLRICLAD